jgi:hypothetical protein
MKRKGSSMKRLGVMVALAIAILAMAASAPASTTQGTWYFHPAQTYTDTTVTTTGTAYKTVVRPPINADGSSNWPAKRGVIPVQFDLLAAPTTTTTTTRTYDPPVWQSLQADGSVSYATFCLVPLCTGPGSLTFAQITNLSADYLFTTGDCKAGSLRWTIYVQHGSNVESVHVYYGNPNGVPDPPGQSCSGASSETGQNLISSPLAPPNRFEMQGGWGVPGPLYTTYADALASTNGGTDLVVGAQLTLDSGFAGDQKANVSNVTVNDNTWVPKTVETSSSTVSGAYAKTCALPQAELRWSKDDPFPDGAINEAESIQPKDTGQYYRIVDCKYIYNLDVTSLSGQGTYRVYARINNMNLMDPAKFDLK